MCSTDWGLWSSPLQERLGCLPGIRRLFSQHVLGDEDEALSEVGQIPVPAVAHHQPAQGGGVGQGEQVYILRGGLDPRQLDGPQEQLGTDDDAHPLPAIARVVTVFSVSRMILGLK